MKTSLQALLATDSPIVADGGMGTMLFNAGLPRGEAPEGWNVTHPDLVRGIHAAYIAAGAQIVLTNSFGGSRTRLALHGLGDRVADFNTAAAQLARAEADAASHPVLVGGSIGPTGQMLEPLGDLSMAEAVEIPEEQARALAAGAVDLFWIETMSALEEVQAAVEGCRRASATLPQVATMTFDTHGRTMMGVSPAQAVMTLHELGVTAWGANCGNGPAEIEAVITAMHEVNAQAVLIAKANAGLPRMANDVAVYDASPDDMAQYAQRVLAGGARIVGACCGSTPEHIRAIADTLRAETA